MKIINPKTIWIALSSICYLFYGLNTSMWVAIFPQKAATTVCLGFFLYPSSMWQTYLQRATVLSKLEAKASCTY